MKLYFVIIALSLTRLSLQTDLNNIQQEIKDIQVEGDI
jgi:hypothetical protein